MSGTHIGLWWWILVPLFNFGIWFLIGKTEHPVGYFENEICPPPPPPIIIEAPPCIDSSLKGTAKTARLTHSLASHRLPVHPCGSLTLLPNPHMESVSADKMSEYRNEDLVKMKFPGWATLVSPHGHPDNCESFVNPSLGKKKECIAVVFANTRVAHPLLRYDQDAKWKGLITKKQEMFPTGFFRRVGNKKGRDRIAVKMGPLFVQLTDVEELIREKMKQQGIKKEDNVVVMVVNAGEIDLFMNFACSLKAHNMTLHNVIMFTGSSDIVSVVEATGAGAVYHTSFAAVSKKPSGMYLDSVFVDMMWYKAFSVWLMLRQGVHVLFQDVDLVWFKDPFVFFHDYILQASSLSPTGAHPDAFFSDDGQRSLRYSPFYANSGFYYLLNNKRTKHFAWSVMAAFDLLQTTGSHQNVFTMKLNEQIDMAGIHPKLLRIYDFPTGIMHHNSKKYMDKIRTGEFLPYHFHMCWTAGKPDKIVYFKDSNMWYIKDSTCSLESLHPKQGVVGRRMDRLDLEGINRREKWSQLSNFCCTRMENAP